MNILSFYPLLQTKQIKVRISKFFRLLFNLHMYDRGVSSFLNLVGQLVMQRVIAAQRRLLFCQKVGEQLPTLPTRNLRPYDKIWLERIQDGKLELVLI